MSKLHNAEFGSKWEYEVGLVKQAKLDLAPFTSKQSLHLRKLARSIVSRFRSGKGCAIINGSVNWGYANEGSDIDIDYYPYDYNSFFLKKLFLGEGTVEVDLRHKFDDQFNPYGCRAQPLLFYHSIKELMEYLKQAKKTGKVPMDLKKVHKSAQCGIVIGNELENIIANPEQLKESELDKLFESLSPVGSSIEKFIKILESKGQTIPESVTTLRDYIESNYSIAISVQ